MKALGIIRNEHLSLAAVLHAMLYLVHDLRDRGTQPNFELLGAIIYYIDAFPERFHHPKEDQYLFPLLRARHPEAGLLIDRLENEHVEGAHLVRTLEQALARYSQGGWSEFKQFLAAVEGYADFHWKHMRAEEYEMLPLAERHLTASDWLAVDAAFEGNSDPLLGAVAGERYADLFRRIVSLAPPPIGVGPEAVRILSKPRTP